MPGIVAPAEGVIDLTVNEDDEHEEVAMRPSKGTIAGRDGTNQTSLFGNQPGRLSLNHGSKLTTPLKPATILPLPNGSRERSPKSIRVHQSQGGTSQLLNGGPNKLQTPRVTPRKSSLNVDKIVTQLNSFAAEIDNCNTRVVRYTLQEVIKNAPKPKHLSATDCFDDMPSLAQGRDSEGSVPLTFKSYVGTHAKRKSHWFPVTRVKSDVKRVPRYRFHHVQIAKNILTPNTMLKFLPHLGDLRPEEEPIYAQWTEELQNMDSKTGVASSALDPVKKAQRTKKDEQASVIYGYLDRWIQRLGLECCNKSTLIRHMASQTPGEDDAMTPQQKSSLLDSNIGNTSSPHAQAEAKVFTDAFNRVFGAKITLDEVLRLDETVETFVETNKRVKDTPSSQKQLNEQLLLSVETTLATYSIFGCLICFGHDCEHGDYTLDNEKHHFSIEGMGGMGPQLRKKWVEQTKKQKSAFSSRPGSTEPCKNQCWMNSSPHRPPTKQEDRSQWTDSEIQVLKSMFATLGRTSISPECAVASILGRRCCNVYEKRIELSLTLPQTELPPELPSAKSLAWYDRHEKVLKGDWPECTISHEHWKRLLCNPCHHDGPCSAANKCPCVLNKLLCERFCQCTAECCPYKFTGCACHSSGKTCLQRQKEGKKPCICVQLNRECDPVLCGGCGAKERADPLNALDEGLHATGCQNVALQRGIAKPVLMGESQLEGCGYGLFAAADISQDEYVIEYAGELISHDEGVRREARRGNVFDETSNSSYLFTLLDTEGIWVDAAIYGNLSRYINHAGHGDKKGANVTPKILYVLGEFRIRFTAMRDIKCGEELFFNYGENFPNLTKKLLEEKDAGSSGKDADSGGVGPVKRKPGRPPGSRTATKSVGKTTSAKGKQKEVSFRPGIKPGRRGPKKATKLDASGDTTEWEPDDAEEQRSGDDNDTGVGTLKGYRKYLGKVPDDDDGDREYRPARDAGQEEVDAYTLARDRRRRANAGSRMNEVVHKLERDLKLAAPATPKRVSKRGGARPGAGRKPKNHPKFHGGATNGAPTQASPASATGNTTISAGDKVDSDDEPLAQPRVTTEEGTLPAADSLGRRGERTRKRKASEILQAEDETDEYAQSGGSDKDDEGEEDEGMADRSRRTRRKPSRYTD